MSNEQDPVVPEVPNEAELGRGAPGTKHSAFETPKTKGTNAADAIIPSGAPTELSEHQVEVMEKAEDQEAGFHTTDGYVTDEAGMLNNFAVEPPMYYEDEEPPKS